MKKAKRPWSRKKRALLRFVFLPPLLALLMLSRRYGFTEEQALWEHEEQMGLGPTQVIRNLGKLPFGEIENEHMTLSGNENALLLSMQRFDWKNGWESAGRAVLDCSAGNSVMGSYWLLSEMGKEPEPQLYYFFGEVTDDTVQSLRIRMKEGKQEKLVWEQEVSGKDWIEWKGRRLFLTSWQPEKPWDKVTWRTFEMVSTDASGRSMTHVFQNWTKSSVF